MCTIISELERKKMFSKKQTELLFNYNNIFINIHYDTL